jgi:hypothetical protein
VWITVDKARFTVGFFERRLKTSSFEAPYPTYPHSFPHPVGREKPALTSAFTTSPQRRALVITNIFIKEI